MNDSKWITPDQFGWLFIGFWIGMDVMSVVWWMTPK